MSLFRRKRRSRRRRQEVIAPPPKPGARKRLAALGVAVIAGGWLGWQIVGNTVADTRGNPALALKWRPDHPEQLARLAETQLAPEGATPDVVAARATAEKALVATPLNQRGLRAFALAADAEGDSRGAALMDIAGERAPRDALTQVWLLERDLTSASYDDAAERLDRILRSRPKFGEAVSPLVSKFAANAPDILAARLATSPPWRRPLLLRLAAEAPPETAVGLYRILAAGDAPPNGRELKALLDRLIATGGPAKAYGAWLQFRADTGGVVPYLNNGSFETTPSGIPFDWMVDASRGVLTEFPALGDEKALRVTFSGTRFVYHHLRQVMVLPAGDYVFSGEGKAPALETERGLVWRITCADGTVIATTPHYRQTPEWQAFSVAFTVPAQGCDSQAVGLMLDARVASEELARGEIWFDDLKVVRNTAARPLASLN